MGETVQVKINGQQHEVEQGTRILDYLLKQGVDHPHICYSEVLGPIQTCDTCMCEVDGKILRACSTKFEEGMNILTSSERAKNFREDYHFPLRYLLYIGITAAIRFIIVNNGEPIQNIWLSVVIFVLTISYIILPPAEAKMIKGLDRRYEMK
ncbi:2Fe-2S iron-sulfur cluster-binding protein [Fictibacillus sp. Mic-4]|uniref:2Fe-2S iron-sulfur cluster-binding protein n=1 Tax=Fictibacillus sp. Mic-4 TaxID=3132826 RepID=UPI003CF0B446